MEAFNILLNRILINAHRWKNIPGDVVSSLSSEIRQALSKLKSDDLDSSKIRMEEAQLWADNQENQEDKQLRVQFTEKLK
jgi:hypothetical protein